MELNGNGRVLITYNAAVTAINKYPVRATAIPVSIAEA